MIMRTIAGAAQHFREIDPDSAITAHAIRRLIKSGAVPCVRAGTKYLVAIENLDAYFAGDTPRIQLQKGVRRAGGN